jgi:hypothetical protein
MLLQVQLSGFSGNGSCLPDCRTACVGAGRAQQVLEDDDVMICNCKPRWRGGTGCGPDCINRMLCVECVEVRAGQTASTACCASSVSRCGRARLLCSQPAIYDWRGTHASTLCEAAAPCQQQPNMGLQLICGSSALHWASPARTVSHCLPLCMTHRLS